MARPEGARKEGGGGGGGGGERGTNPPVALQHGTPRNRVLPVVPRESMYVVRWSGWDNVNICRENIQTTGLKVDLSQTTQNNIS